MRLVLVLAQRPLQAVRVFGPTEIVNEERLKIDDQWYYRGNRSPSWFFVASRADGSCQGGISERVPRELWPALERVAILEQAMRAIVKVLDGKQPKDIPGALMVAQSALNRSTGDEER